MPSQISHQLFAEDVIHDIFKNRGEKQDTAVNKLIWFGAQGPDIFYHNRRTKPSSYGYGRRIHKNLYGRLVRNYVKISREKGLAEAPEIRAYIAGFSTHAALDRYAHPYILYHAGWVEPLNTASRKYHRMHAFFERIIDICLLKKFRGMEIDSYDFSCYFDIACLPRNVSEVIVPALRETYVTARKRPITEESLDSAVADTLFFYRMTNPGEEENKIEAYKHERDDERSYRLLALFYPRNVPTREFPGGYDFLNEENRLWCDPCKPEVTSTDSFFDLYRKAEAKARVGVQTVLDGLDGENIDRVEETVGNSNLTDGRTTDNCTPQKSSPFPLSEILDAEYAEMKRRVD